MEDKKAYDGWTEEYWKKPCEKRWKYHMDKKESVVKSGWGMMHGKTHMNMVRYIWT